MVANGPQSSSPDLTWACTELTMQAVGLPISDDRPCRLLSALALIRLTMRDIPDLRDIDEAAVPSPCASLWCA